MKHAEFIRKITVSENVIKEKATLSNEDLALKYQLRSPRSVAGCVRFYKNHNLEPRWPIASNLTHSKVLKLSEFIDLSDVKKARQTMIERFQETPTSQFKTKIQPASEIRIWELAAKLCNLNAGSVGGARFVVHWNERP